MNKQLKKLHVTAADICHCLLCGGVNGNCTCVAAVGSNLQLANVRTVTDLRSEWGKRTKGACSHLLCESCGGVVSFDKDLRLVRCKCGRICKHDFELPVIPEPDYGLVDDLTELPKRALRKPKI